MVRYYNSMWFFVCSCMVLTNHTPVRKFSDQPWQQAGVEPDSQYLSKYWSFLLTWMATSFLSPIGSCWYDQIWKGWKTTVFSLPRDDELGFPTSPNFNYLRRRAWPANFGLPIRPPLLKVGERERIWMQKVEFIIFFHFSHFTWMKSQHFHATFFNSAANMRQSTVKERGNSN